ncbi:hypothetical protein [Helicobacter cholecystus]|uniref:hypothetical protein n=1 Tax=Helicobacter cholecystus TaxID=45498 RepID=UPI002738C0E5|nr:hypothetical protein [Helicobacter cholecystus]
MTIKDRCYEILKNHKKPMTHVELVEAYILAYPLYSQNHNQTKNSSKVKISGTIQSLLQQNSSHPRIGIDYSCSPYKYFIKEM